MSKYFGIINLNKPHGMTSRQAVDRVKWLVQPAKVGHAGTLDPLASGVLVVCVGPATRLIDDVQKMPKTYRATFLLGRESPSEDLETEVTALTDPPVPSLTAIEQACVQFTGAIDQRPPAFSALKVDGKRAYRLARAGKEVVLAPRQIVIYSLSIARYDYPELTLDIICSAGTYIRSLGRDVAVSLGSAAVMSHLVRTAIGPFTLADAVDPNGLSLQNLAGALQPPLKAMASMPRVIVTPAQQEHIAAAIMLSLPEHSAPQLAALSPTGDLLAILARRADGLYSPNRNFVGRG